MHSPRAIREWIAKRKARQNSLAINGRNTQRLRGKIRAAKKQKRFFAYLVSLSPFLPLAVFLPLLAIEPATRKFGAGKLESAEAVVKVVGLVLTSLMSMTRIFDRWVKFKRVLKLGEKVN